jgi:hypothetical protein
LGTWRRQRQPIVDPFWQPLRWRNGKCVWWRNCPTEKEALEAAGLSELLQRPWREWSAPEFEVRAEGPIAAGIDGEALSLQAPLRFRIRPSVLRVRIARQHPGASPSAAIPEGISDGIRTLLRRAADRETTGAAAPDSGHTNSGVNGAPNRG